MFDLVLMLDRSLDVNESKIHCSNESFKNFTPLMLTLFSCNSDRNFKMFTYLVEALGADIHAKDFQDSNILHLAVEYE